MSEEGLSQFITDYIAGRKQPKLEAFDKESEKMQAAETDPERLALLKQQRLEERLALEQRYQPNAWLSDAAARAGQISLVTHALKFTHSDAKGSSVFSTFSVDETAYLSSLTIREPAIDAVGNAAALDVAKLLQTEYQGDSLLASLRRDDYRALQPFAENAGQLEQWVSGFKASLSDKQLSSHKLAKQIYFPLNARGEYHLLSPLYSSSLADALYKTINDTRFSEESKALRKARREKRWRQGVAVDYPQLAVQSIGGTKPQNISYLNSTRGGKSYLLRCAPPEWQQVLQPPAQEDSIFSKVLSGITGTAIWQLKRYLISVAKLSNTMEIRQQRAQLVDDIIGIIFNYVAEIQSISGIQGWSRAEDCKLKLSQQLWLDPLRQDVDPAFKLDREKGDWQKEIANDFAYWITRRLNKVDTLAMGRVEFRELSGLFYRRLREFDAGRLEIAS